jgi:hypothetical protein
MTARTVPCNQTAPVPAPAATVPVRPGRSPHVICELTRLAVCGYCWAASLQPCATGPAGVEGYHLARFTRAWSRGLISDSELAVFAVASGSPSESAVIYDDIPREMTTQPGVTHDPRTDRRAAAAAR